MHLCLQYTSTEYISQLMQRHVSLPQQHAIELSCRQHIPAQLAVIVGVRLPRTACSSLPGTVTYRFTAHCLLLSLHIAVCSLTEALMLLQVVPAQYAFVVHTANPISKKKGETFGEVVMGMGEALVGNYPGRALSFSSQPGQEVPPLFLMSFSNCDGPNL